MSHILYHAIYIYILSNIIYNYAYIYIIILCIIYSHIICIVYIIIYIYTYILYILIKSPRVPYRKVWDDQLATPSLQCWLPFLAKGHGPWHVLGTWRSKFERHICIYIYIYLFTYIKLHIVIYDISISLILTKKKQDHWNSKFEANTYFNSPMFHVPHVRDLELWAGSPRQHYRRGCPATPPLQGIKFRRGGMDKLENGSPKNGL